MMELWIGFGVVLLVMLVGLFGNLIPGVPGTSLIFVGALAHQLYYGDAGGIGWIWLVVLGVLMAVSFLVDYVASLLGAKTLGASWRGVLGALVGIIGGLIIFPPLGLIIGPFVGAMGFEWAFGRETREAAKAGIGAALGVMLGMVGSAMCGVAMMGIFFSPRSLTATCFPRHRKSRPPRQIPSPTNRRRSRSPAKAATNLPNRSG